MNGQQKQQHRPVVQASVTPGARREFVAPTVSEVGKLSELTLVVTGGGEL